MKQESSHRVRVCETFTSLQGESTHAGLPCFFIRLSGCNLRCRYCDTAYAWEGGRRRDVSSLVAAAGKSRAALVEITGGEPLMQDGFRELALRLRDESGKTVLVETNGSLDISVIPARVIAVMDLKCPGSGECGKNDVGNIRRLRQYDEVKFVVSDRKDYEWARACVKRHKLAGRCRAVLFSPAWGRLPAKRLGTWIAEDGLPVRLQVPLHKVLGVR